MAVIEGEQAIQRLGAMLREKDDPNDPGMLADAAAELEEVFQRIRTHVERGGKACKGSVTIVLNLHGYKSKGGEIAVDIDPDIKSKAPTKHRKRSAMVFLDHDGIAHTTPQQEEMPLFDKNQKAIEGGKGKDQGSKEEKKGKAI